MAARSEPTFELRRGERAVSRGGGSPSGWSLRAVHGGGGGRGGGGGVQAAVQQAMPPATLTLSAATAAAYLSRLASLALAAAIWPSSCVTRNCTWGAGR